MSRSIFEMNYGRLIKIISEDILRNAPVGSAGKSESGAYMDFHFDVLDRPDENTVIIAISHYGRQNGDSMADPDMQLRIRFHSLMNMVEPMTFQNDYVGVYQEVYVDENRFYPKLRDKLNSFLKTWLITLREQGHKITEVEN